PARFAESPRRNLAELEQPAGAPALERLRRLAGDGPLTLLTATVRADISHAAVLAGLLDA
ncbi:DUF488 family protein, partial [Nonomuraea sp. NPDC050733]|uniref:DUF488 family protein n=1 Tax=Nonomuraea sp. NPDC050733 TaxID=3154633 RepID=UPI0033EA5263